MGGYFLTLTCSCGAAFDRWVTEEESRELPRLMTSPAAPPREPAPARDPAPRVVQTLKPPAAGESLQDLMQQALESVEKAPPPPAPRQPPKPDASPLQAALDSTLAELEEKPPPTRAAPPAPGVAPGVGPSATAAPARTPPAPAPPRPAPPPRQGRPTPKPPTAPPAAEMVDAATPEDGTGTPVDPPAATRNAPLLTVDRNTLEEVMKRALEEVGTAKPGKRRDAPDTGTLKDALRTALDEYDTENRQRGGPGVVLRTAIPVDLGPAPAPRRSRSRLAVAAALAVVVLLSAGIGVWYTMQRRSASGAVSAAAPSKPVKPRLPAEERAPVTQAMSALRELQGVTRVDVPFRVYVNRVAFAKSDVDRYLQSIKDLEARSTIQEVLAIHALAAAAWRAKTINERERWEAVGDDPSVELCPPAKRLLAVGEDPQTMTRSQWRGFALAAAIPILWDCAAERVAEADKSFRDR